VLLFARTATSQALAFARVHKVISLDLPWCHHLTAPVYDKLIMGQEKGATRRRAAPKRKPFSGVRMPWVRSLQKKRFSSMPRPSQPPVVPKTMPAPMTVL
jgi:hypothetical protein